MSSNVRRVVKYDSRRSVRVRGVLVMRGVELRLEIINELMVVNFVQGDGGGGRRVHEGKVKLTRRKKAGT